MHKKPDRVKAMSNKAPLGRGVGDVARVCSPRHGHPCGFLFKFWGLRVKGSG